MADNVGAIEYDARISTANLKRDAGIVDDTVNNVGKNVERNTRGIEEVGSRSFNAYKAAGIAAFAAVGAAVVANIGNAVNRIDTLNNFPKVLEAMGIQADKAQQATNKISKSLNGLPTSLDEGTRGVQRFVAAGLGVEKSTDLFLAMNNALIVGGADAADTQVAFDGMVRAISAGEVPASTLTAMLSRMPTVMAALQKSTGKSQDELTQLFEKNPQSLVDNLIKLNQEGGGGLASLESQARKATDGIGTGFDNMNTAITRGITNIFKAIGSSNISNLLASIGKSFENGLTQVANFATFIVKNGDIFGPIAAGILAFTAALAAARVAIMLASAAQAVFNAVLTANPIGIVIVAIAAIVAALVFLETKFKILSQTISFLKPVIEPIARFIGEQFKKAWDDLSGAISSLMTTLAPVMPQLKIIAGVMIAVALGPLAILVTAIVAVVVIGARLIGWIAQAIASFLQFAAQVGTAIAQFRQSVANGINTAVRYVEELPGRIVGAISGLGSRLYTMGTNIIQGLINGIRDKIGGVISAANDAASAVTKKVQSVLGIKSPSRVMMQMGDYIMQGLSIGMDRSSGLAVNSAANASNSVLGAFGTGMSVPMNNNLSLGSGQAMGRTQVTQNNYIKNDIDLKAASRQLANDMSRG